MTSELMIDIQRMSVAEKLEVMEAIWSDLIKNESSIPVPEWHKQILDSRRRAYERGEIGYTPWEEAKAEIRRRLA